MGKNSSDRVVLFGIITNLYRLASGEACLDTDAPSGPTMTVQS